MAKTPITIKQLVDASEDATSLEEFVYKPADYLVKRRLAPDTYSLQHYIDNFNTVKNEQSNQVVAMNNEIAKVVPMVESAIEGVAIDANLVTDALVATVPIAPDTAKRNQASVNKDSLNALSFFKQEELADYQANPLVFDATAALQRAIFAASALGRKLNAYGTFKITDTIVINGSVDLGEATIESYVLGKESVVIRPVEPEKYLWYARIVMPALIRDMTKSGTGWASNAENTGVLVHNTMGCDITFGAIRNFGTNLHFTAKNNRGCGYNEFHLGHLDNGKVNLLIDSGNGWFNENNFFGGRLSHLSSEGVGVSGCRHIKIVDVSGNTPNNNVFYKPSIEGNTPEYHVENGGTYNTINSARWEANPPKVLYKKQSGSSSAASQANRNLIDGGYGAFNIEITNEGDGGGFRNELRAIGKGVYPISNTNAGHRYANAFSGSADSIAIFASSLASDLVNVPYEKYAVSLGEKGLSLKTTDDTATRIFLDASKGRIYLNSLGQPLNDKYISYIHTTGFWFNDSVCPSSTAANYNLGHPSNKWSKAYLSGAVGSWGVNPPSVKPVVTGSTTDGTALKSLLTALASYGLITDSTT